MKYLVDLGIILILALFIVRSLRSPLASELTGAIGWLFAILAAIGFSDPIGNMLATYVPSFKELTPYLSFLAIVIILRLLLGFLGKLVPEEPKGAVGAILKVIAALFGFFKGAFFISVVLLMISTSSGLQSKVDGYTGSSFVYPHIKTFSLSVVNAVTEHVPNVEALLKRLS